MFEKIISTVKAKAKIDLGTFDESFLSKSILKRYDNFLLSNQDEYIIKLESNPLEINNLIDSMQITYTNFYRDSLVFSYLERIILPNVLARKSKTQIIRIWCSACSSGQEAYSIAFSIEKYMESMRLPFKYHIFATDYNTKVLEKARVGTYSIEQLDNITLRDFENNFIKKDNKYIVIPKIKSKITFSTHDLVNSSLASPAEGIYGDFDIIFCCNVLYYYNRKTKSKILSKLGESLNEKGYLVIDSVDEKHTNLKKYVHHVSGSVPVFVKNNN
jgi:chemotaxis methyl-accepting protein methylase